MARGSQGNTSRMKPAERQLRLALFVREYGPVTRQQIREAMGEDLLLQDSEAQDGKAQVAARRMFERDKQTLAEMGIVITADEHGSYTLDTQASICAPVELTQTQIDLVRMACSSLLASEDCSFKDELRMVLVKLSDELETPDSLPDLDSFQAAEENDSKAKLEKIKDSLDRCKRLTFDYNDALGTYSSKREVEPMGCVYRGGNGYLAAWDAERQGNRIFRLDRISKLKVAKGAKPDFELRPFNPQDMSLLPFAMGTEQVECQIGFSPEIAWRAEQLTEGRGSLEEGTDQALVWHTQCASFQQLASWCVANGPGIAPLSPSAACEAYDQLKADSLHAAQHALEAPVGNLRSYAEKAAKLQGKKGGHKGAQSGKQESGDEAAQSLVLPLFALLERAGAVSIPQAAKLLGSTEQAAYKALELLVFVYDAAASVRLELGEEGCAYARLRSAPSQILRLSAAEAAALQDALAAMGVAPDDELFKRLVTTKGTCRSSVRDESASRVRLVESSCDSTVAATVAQACGQEPLHVLEISYQKYSESQSQVKARVVEPLRVFDRHGRAYMHAWCRQAGEWREFRLDRIRQARLLGETCEPQLRNDVPSVSEASLYDEASVALVSLPEEGLVPEWHGLRKVTVDAFGRHIASVPWYGSPWLPRQVASTGGLVQALYPPEFVRAVLEVCE